MSADEPTPEILGALNKGKAARLGTYQDRPESEIVVDLVRDRAGTINDFAPDILIDWNNRHISPLYVLFKSVMVSEVVLQTDMEERGFHVYNDIRHRTPLTEPSTYVLVGKFDISPAAFEIVNALMGFRNPQMSQPFGGGFRRNKYGELVTDPPTEVTMMDSRVLLALDRPRRVPIDKEFEMRKYLNQTLRELERPWDQAEYITAAPTYQSDFTNAVRYLRRRISNFDQVFLDKFG